MTATGDRAAARGSRGREMAVAAVVCAAGAGLVLLAAGRGWADATVAMPAPLPARRVALSGGDVAPSLNGLGLAGLAGLAGIIATRAVARIVVGALIAAIGAGTVVSSIGAARTSRVLALLHERVAMSDATAVHSATTGWWLAAVAGGALLALAGAATIARGRRWPGMSSRYDAPRATRRAQAAAASAAPSAATPDNLWDSLDSGADPTADPSDDLPDDPPGATTTEPRGAGATGDRRFD